MRSRSPRSLDSAPESRRRSGRSSTSEHSHPAGSGSRQRARQAGASKAPAAGAPRPRAAVGAAHLGKQDLLCSLIGLGVKLGLVMVTGVSLVRVASAYQARMDRQGELAAVLQIENVQLTKAQQRFDRLFLISGEKTLAREQSQWIAPNRLRVVWQAPAAPTKAPAAPAKASATPSKTSSAPSKAAANAPDPAPQRPPGPLASAPLKDSAKVPPTGTGGLAQPGDLGGN
ncbi:MAG: hypothetical protein ACK5RA_08620 [Cyanobacteriota bacterium]